MVSFVIAIAILLFLFTRFDIDLKTSWENIRQSDPFLYFLAFASYYISFPLRGLRWRLLLQNVGVERETGSKLPSILGLSECILLGWFANCILWFRLGDAYRAHLLSEKMKISFSKTIGTVLAERIIDVFVVSCMLLVAILGIWGSRRASLAGSIVLAALGLLLAVIIGLALMSLLGKRLARFMPKRLESAYGLFHEGTLGSFRKLPIIAVLSLVIWVFETGRLYFVIQALGLSVGFPLILFVALAHSLITTIPITPGGLGLAETGMTGLLMIALSREQAVSAALLDRSISYASIVLVGLLVFLFRQIKSARVAAAAVQKKVGSSVSEGEA